MSEQPTPDRFKAEMPAIPGVSGSSRHGANPAIRLVVGLLAVLALVFLGARFVLKTKQTAPSPPQPTPQIEVAAPAPDPNASIPQATEVNPGIATEAEMAKPWSSKNFSFRNRLTGESVPSLIMRLPTGSSSQPGGYWAFALTSPYGNCQLEYVTDIGKLKTEYGFHPATHPMVGNPCSHTLFDPTKMANLPGGAWARGFIAQGSDLRPPLGIELKIENKNILAVRME
jgi:hypothetical protein